MSGKKYVKCLGKKKEVLNRKLTRSRKFKVGKCKGKIKAIDFVTTKNQSEAVSLEIINEEQRSMGKFFIFHNTDRGMRIVDNILDCLDEDEVELDELEGLVIGFETELNGEYLNLRSIFSVDDDYDDDEILEEEELLDEDDEYEEDDDEYEEEEILEED